MMITKKSSEKYLFDISNYEIISNINEGGFGIINLVREKKTGEKYATKTNLIRTGKQNKLFVSREIRILIQIQHPTIIQFRGFSYEDFGGNNNITILMDYMKEGSLAELISKEQKGICPANYDNTKRQLILIGIARGMMILHKNHIIHRDLKPENILLDSDFHPHITDFGLSKFFDPFNSLTQSIADFGTAPYMAPEVIDGDNFNTKADVYAFGILMYEVITGKRAYYDLFHGKKKITVFQLKTNVLKGHRPNIDERSMKKGFQIMIEKCWSKDPKERPTFQELFHKLSLSSDDDILEFEARQEDQVIIDDDDDEDDEIDELGISNRVKKFCLSEVDYSELFDYIDDINKEASSFDQQQNEDQRLNKELFNKIKKMEEKIESLEEELDKSKLQMIKMNEIIDDQQKEIKSLKTELKSAGKKQMNQLLHLLEKNIDCISAKISETEPGILNLLKNKETSYFDPLFIPSKSSRDIYKIIDPNTKQLFCTNSFNFTFLEFEFKDRIGINGMQIFTGGRLFPRSFDIEIDGKIVKSIKDASELNKKFACMTINFDPISAKKVRFIQTDLPWDNKNKNLFINRIEFLSYEEKYSKGVFSTFIEENETHDPHKCPVHITSSFSDFDSFFMVDSKKYIYSSNLKNEWFQIELLHGSAILTGCRIKSFINRLKSFKIICTDDVNKPIEEWTTLLEIYDKPKEENAQIQTYEFKEQSPNTKFVRLIKTGPDWDNQFYLNFYHFDLFGWYF